MKATIDIADNLLTEARAIAHRDQTTLRSLVEAGLYTEVGRRRKPGRVCIQPVIVHGGRLTPEFQNASWEQIRDEIYRGHGA